jgi:Glyoxalase-like domain
MTLAIDHLVVAAPSLDEGVRWCEATLGITPGPGGTHPLMGTHNRLFSIADARFADVFFEIIAIDPAAPSPGRARWFALDEIDLSGGPRLIHWVARCEAIDDQLAALRAAGLDAHARR